MNELDWLTWKLEELQQEIAGLGATAESPSAAAEPADATEEAGEVAEEPTTTQEPAGQPAAPTADVEEPAQAAALVDALSSSNSSRYYQLTGAEEQPTAASLGLQS